MNAKNINWIDDLIEHPLWNQNISQDVLIFIACQFALESAFGRSRLAVTHHNYCGMKVPKQRYFYGYSTEDSPFAWYDSFDKCILDYQAWLTYCRFGLKDIQNVHLFANKLKACGYCLEPDYIQSIINLYNSYKNE